jgi:hypothetical protein
MLLEPSFQIKPIKCHPLFANRNFSHMWAHLDIEPIPVHPEKVMRIL